MLQWISFHVDANLFLEPSMCLHPCSYPALRSDMDGLPIPVRPARKQPERTDRSTPVRLVAQLNISFIYHISFFCLPSCARCRRNGGGLPRVWLGGAAAK